VRPTLPTRAGVLCAVLGALLCLAGSNIGSGWVVLVGAALLAAVLADGLAARADDVRTAVEGHLDGEPTSSADAPLHLRITRPARARTALRVADAATRGRAVVTAGGASDVVLPVRLARGHHAAVGLTRRTSGPLGLAARRGTADVRIGRWSLPAALPVRGHLPAASGVAGDGAVASARAGEEVHGLRPHAPGDRRTAVAWRASARRGDLLVRETTARPAGAVRLCVHGGAWTAPALDLAAVLVASVATAAATAGEDVEVAADGAVHRWSDATRRVLAALPPAVGVAPRPLRAEPPSAAHLHLAGDEEGVRVQAGDRVERIPDEEALRAWLLA
jgi:uncharacterized protein (DUF58 family)